MVFNANQSEDIYNAVRLVHSEKHVDLIRSISDKGFNSKRNRIATKFNSIYFNKGSSEAAYLAAGSVVEVNMIAFQDFICYALTQVYLYTSYTALCVCVCSFVNSLNVLLSIHFISEITFLT